tara:strand:+ start:404 stop:1204 length:801 start_codon:yes stop_codon:yes gene_type:complete
MNNFKEKLKNLFPIESQTSDLDKIVLLQTLDLIRKKNSYYKYLEIGSFLGGSLTPALMDKKCKKVLSIDKRNQILDDERNENWSYKNVSNALMVRKINQYKINTLKLDTYDGDIKEIKNDEEFDLIFIDGIHTVENCFSDLINSLRFKKKNSIILFHDTSIIFKAIKLCLVFLENQKISYKIIKFKNSEMSGLFFGSYIKNNFKKNYITIENFNKFCDNAQDKLLLHQINNRLKIKFKFWRFLKNKYPFKLELLSKKTKRSLDFHK